MYSRSIEKYTFHKHIALYYTLLFYELKMKNNRTELANLHIIINHIRIIRI